MNNMSITSLFTELLWRVLWVLGKGKPDTRLPSTQRADKQGNPCHVLNPCPPTRTSPIREATPLRVFEYQIDRMWGHYQSPSAVHFFLFWCLWLLRYPRELQGVVVLLNIHVNQWAIGVANSYKVGGRSFSGSSE